MTDNGKNNVGIGSEDIQLEGLEDDNIQNVMKKIDEDPNNIFIQTGKSSDGNPKTVFLVNGKDKLPKGQVICEDLKNIKKKEYSKLELVDNPNGDCNQTVKSSEQNQPKNPPLSFLGQIGKTFNYNQKKPEINVEKKPEINLKQLQNVKLKTQLEQTPIKPAPTIENKNKDTKTILTEELGKRRRDVEPEDNNSINSSYNDGDIEGGKYKKHSIYNTNKRNKKTYKKRDKFGRFIKNDQKKSRRSKK